MGLIKAAIIVGGGAYAIKKISERRAQHGPQCHHGASNNYIPNRDMPQQQYYDSTYPPEKYTDQSQSDGQRQIEGGQPQVHPYPLEFVDRRSPHQQQQEPLYLNNHSQPFPQSYESNTEYYNAQGPPPQYQPTYRQRQQPHGFIEPEELSQSDAQSVQSRKGGISGQRFLDTLAQQATRIGNSDKKGKSPKEYLETFLAK